MSLEEKQEYLRREILSQGYHAESFYDFWQTFSIGTEFGMKTSMMPH
jgi:hypothetical protein